MDIKIFLKHFYYFLDKMIFTMAYLCFFTIIIQLFFNLDTEPIVISRQLFHWITGISICLALLITIRDKFLKSNRGRNN